MRAALAALFVGTLLAQPEALRQAQGEADRWLERLQQWTVAVDRHEIGTLDEPAQEIAAWSIANVQDIAVDVRLLVAMMRSEGLDPNEFRVPKTDSRGRVTLIRWRYVSREQAEVLKLLAHAEARRGHFNRLLKRGAMLHTDVAMRAPVPEQPANPAADTRPRRAKLYFADGRKLTLVDTTPHWNIARALLDEVDPSPGRDAMVRTWYQATSAHQQSEEQLDPGHLARALELFPKDPDVLFFNACLHETNAAPATYPALEAASLPAGLRLPLESRGAELRQSERLFRQALTERPAFVEARVRLGRVLAILGRHQDAAVELRRASSESDDPLLQYYANLFLGGEEAALGRTDPARAAYERAASLFPQAQSPHLGLSELARRSNDRPAARRSLEHALSLPSPDDGRVDPWWTYHIAQGRDADDRLQALYRMF